MENENELLRGEPLVFDETPENLSGFIILPCFNVMPRNKEEFRNKLEKSLESVDGFIKVELPYNGGICRGVVKIHFNYPRLLRLNEGETLKDAEIATINEKIPSIKKKCIEVLKTVELDKI